MSWADMIGGIERELAFTGLEYDRAELQEWVEACWPRIDDDPDPVRWAREFGEMIRARQQATAT